MVGLLLPLLALAAFAVVIALAVFVIGRLRSGESLTVSPRTVLLGYLYVMTLAGLLTTAVGLSAGLKVALTVPFGSEFSYYQPPVVRPLAPGADGEARPTPEDAEARARAEVERQRRQDLIQAATAVSVGIVVFAAHSIGRRRVGRSLATADALLRRGYTAFLLAVFGIGGLLSLIIGLQEVLQYWLLPAADEYGYRSPPGQSVATAVVFVPLWLFYLQALVRQSRNQE